MLLREEITDDWREWDPAKLARALEACLLPVEEWDEHQSMIPPEQWELLQEPYPQSLGHHPLTGYFITFSGQGPCIGWIEKA